MIGVLLAVLSGLSYGSSDYTGAVASKETDSTLVTVAMQVVSLACLGVWLVIFPIEHRTTVDLAWGALGGLGAAMGLTTFYRALAIGPMSTAASLTALTGATVPVVAGLAMGQRPGPIALVGIALSIPAVMLVSISDFGFRPIGNPPPPRSQYRSRMHSGTTRTLAVVAGFGFGLFFVALAQVSEESGLYPLLGARAASILALSATLTLSHQWSPISRSVWPLIVVTGVLDIAANGFYLTALNYRDLPEVAAIVSLYPVATVLLARAFLSEHLTRSQVAGMGLSVVALALITSG